METKKLNDIDLNIIILVIKMEKMCSTSNYPNVKRVTSELHARARFGYFCSRQPTASYQVNRARDPVTKGCGDLSGAGCATRWTVRVAMG
jgi:hypothetical protein